MLPFGNTISAIVASVASGILLFAGFPPFDLSFLTWMALVPLFLALLWTKPRYGFLLSFLSGIVFLLGIFDWILEIPKYTYTHHTIMVLYLGSYFAFFGLVFSFVGRRWGAAPALLAAPFLWIPLEYIRSNLSFMALPWGLLAHSQYTHPPIIQIASITGAYGVSFLIVMVNSALTASLMPLVSRLRKKKPSSLQLFSKQQNAALVIAAACITLVLAYGHMVISMPIAGDSVKVSVVQGNIEQAKKWDPKYARFIMQTYAELTKEASKDQPALIIWPETATPGAIGQNSPLYAQVRHIAKEAGTFLLLGSAQRQKFESNQRRGFRYRNSAFLIPPEDRATNQRYDKIRLLPFGEYLPMKRTIPWSWIGIPDMSGYVPGNDNTVFNLPDFRFSATICWENIFPDLVRQFVKGGAQLIVNITNEARFGKTVAPYQFLSMNVFRAVENRIYVLRCANTGISCFIDPHGKIVDRVKDEKGSDVFVRGVLTRSIIPFDAETFYTKHGDWLVWVSMFCSVVLLLVAFVDKKPNLL